MVGHDDLADAVSDVSGDGRITRREALKSLAVLGISASAASALLASRDAEAMKPIRVSVGETVRNSAGAATASRPRLPPDEAKGQSAWRMIGWGGYGHVYRRPDDYERWKRWGFGGHATGVAGSKYLYGLGGTNDYVPGSAEGVAGSQYDWQRALEGLGVPKINGGERDLGLFRAAPQLNLESYLGFYCSQATQSSGGRDAKGEATHPPFGDWWDDARWREICATVGRVAGAAHFLGATGITMDAEDSAGNTWYAKPTAGHTRSDQLAMIEERGYQFGQAIFSNFRDPVILVYSWYLRGGISGPIHDQLVDEPDDLAPNEQDQFFFGILRAMTDAGSRGRFVNLDASFYHGRDSAAQASGMSLDSCLKWHGNNSMAVLTRMLPNTTRDFIVRRFDATPFSWAGTDDTPFYKKTQPGQPAYTEMLSTYRRWGLSSRRAEYTSGTSKDGTPEGRAALGLYAGHNNYSFPPNRLRGMAEAASTRPVRSVVPHFRATPRAKAAGRNSHVACEVEHPLGIRRIEVYRGRSFDAGDPEQSYLGTMRMTWDRDQGTYLGGFSSALMSGELTCPGERGEWFVMKAVSLKDDEAWTSVRTQ